MKATLIAMLCFILLISCNGHEISIKKDGKAHIKIFLNSATDQQISKTIKAGKIETDFIYNTLEESDSLDQFIDSLKFYFNSPDITNLNIHLDSINRIVAEYDITNINLASNFLDPISKEKIDFLFGDNSLKVNKLKEINHLDIVLKFEQTIKSIHPKSKYIHKLDAHTIWIENGSNNLYQEEAKENNRVDTVSDKKKKETSLELIKIKLK